MSATETKPSEASELAEISEKFSALERKTALLQAALIVVTMSLVFFVWVQVRRASKDLDAVRPQLAQFSEANRKQDPVIQSLAQKFVDFGRSHPDFTPIVMKYGLNTNTALLNAQLPK